MMKMDQLNEKSNTPLMNTRGIIDLTKNNRPKSSKRESDFFSKIPIILEYKVKYLRR